MRIRYPNDLSLKIKTGLEHYISETYNDFLRGMEYEGERSEFSQIQKLYHIDLSPLLFFNEAGEGIYEEDLKSERDWKLQINVVSDEEYVELYKAYNKKIETAKLQEIEDYKNKWIDTKIVKSTILNLIKKIQKQPELLDQIKYSGGSFNKETFNMFNQDKPRQYYLKNDLTNILNHIDLLESHGIFKMAFIEIY